MIRVIDVAGLNKPAERAKVVYVGRPFAGWKGHALANPFKVDPQNGIAVGKCLEKYRQHLAWMPDLEAALAELWEECEHGEKPLGCWCIDAVVGDGQPVVCHAQILAGMLQERFAEVKERGL